MKKLQWLLGVGVLCFGLAMTGCEGGTGEPADENATVGEKVGKTIDSAIEGGEKAMEQMEEGAKEAFEKVEEGAKEAYEGVKEGVEEATEKAKEAIEGASETSGGDGQ